MSIETLLSSFQHYDESRDSIPSLRTSDMLSRGAKLDNPVVPNISPESWTTERVGIISRRANEDPVSSLVDEVPASNEP
jgi:hypothetical protein